MVSFVTDESPPFVLFCSGIRAKRVTSQTHYSWFRTQRHRGGSNGGVVGALHPLASVMSTGARALDTAPQIGVRDGEIALHGSPMSKTHCMHSEVFGVIIPHRPSTAALESPVSFGRISILRGTHTSCAFGQCAFVRSPGPSPAEVRWIVLQGYRKAARKQPHTPALRPFGALGNKAELCWAASTRCDWDPTPSVLGVGVPP